MRSDHPDEALWVSGVVAPDRSDAVFTVVSTVTGPRGHARARCRCRASTPTARYRVRVRPEAGLPATVQSAPPAWWDDAVGDGIRASGAALGRVGLALPVLAPAQGFLLHLETATD